MNHTLHDLMEGLILVVRSRALRKYHTVRGMRVLKHRPVFNRIFLRGVAGRSVAIELGAASVVSGIRLGSLELTIEDSAGEVIVIFAILCTRPRLSEGGIPT